MVFSLFLFFSGLFVENWKAAGSGLVLLGRIAADGTGGSAGRLMDVGRLLSRLVPAAARHSICHSVPAHCTTMGISTSPPVSASHDVARSKIYVDWIQAVVTCMGVDLGGITGMSPEF